MDSQYFFFFSSRRIPKGESCKQKVSWQCNYVSVFIEIAQRNPIPLKKVNRMWDGWWEGKGRMGSSCSAQGREEGMIGVVGGEGWNKSHTRRTSISVTHRSEGEVLKNVNVVSLFSSINLVLWSIFKNNLWSYKLIAFAISVNKRDDIGVLS